MAVRKKEEERERGERTREERKAKGKGEGGARESIGQLIKIMRGESRHGETSRQRRKG